MVATSLAQGDFAVTKFTGAYLEIVHGGGGQTLFLENLSSFADFLPA